MPVKTIETRGVDSSVEILEKLVLLDTKLKDLEVSLTNIQKDVTEIKDNVAAKP